MWLAGVRPAAEAHFVRQLRSRPLAPETGALFLTNVVYLACCLTVAGSLIQRPAAQSRPLPQFADYPVDSIFSGRPAPVDLSSNPVARRFRTVLRQGARSGPNYAGHLTVVTWGCGTSCIVIAVVDARSGRVFSSPVGAGYGVERHVDSRLLVVDHIACEDTTWAAPYAIFLQWTGRRLQVIDSMPNHKICKA